MSNATVSGTPATGRAQRLGWTATRVVAACLVALLVLGATMEVAGAEPSPGSYQNAFTAACRDHGGAPQRVRTRVVKCTLSDGTVITCDFNVNPPSCTTALTRPPSSPVTAPAGPLSGVNEQPTGGGTHAGGGAGGIDPTWNAEASLLQPSDPGSSDGGGTVLTFSSGQQDKAAHHGKHNDHRHGGKEGRK